MRLEFGAVKPLLWMREPVTIIVSAALACAVCSTSCLAPFAETMTTSSPPAVAPLSGVSITLEQATNSNIAADQAHVDGCNSGSANRQGIARGKTVVGHDDSVGAIRADGVEVVIRGIAVGCAVAIFDADNGHRTASIGQLELPGRQRLNAVDVDVDRGKTDHGGRRLRDGERNTQAGGRQHAGCHENDADDRAHHSTVSDSETIRLANASIRA
jgi:hypothetical protein